MAEIVMTWNETSRYPANLSIDIIPCRLYNSEGVAQLWRNNSFAVPDTYQRWLGRLSIDVQRIVLQVNSLLARHGL